MSRVDRLHWWEELEESSKGKVKRAVNPKGAKKKATKSKKFWIPDCSHWRERFELKDGLHVYASAWMDRPDQQRLSTPQAFEGEPDIGFYLDPRWTADRLLVSPGFSVPFVRSRKTTNKVVVFPWPDYGVPSDPRLLRRTIKWVLAECRRGATVEVGCMGGHGRTGSVLALLLVEQGVSPAQAIRDVWKRYCQEAIESQRQIELIQFLK